MISLRKIATLCMICLSISSFSAEFAIVNETITMTSSNYGFYFYYNTNKGPVNWVSPDNFKAGQVYFRFEILDQPTNEKCYLSFNIWGDYDSDAKTYTESSAPISADLNGPGSVSIFNSSPSTWYANAQHGGVNFNDRTTFWRWGIVHWFSKNPNFLLAPKGYSATPESWEAWKSNYLWLPLQIRVTIVAVSQGSTFSGWDTYLGGSQTKHPTPSYGIDYAGEQTNKIIPSTDEYSLNSNMSGAVNGSGQKLALTPGQDVYFRTKASGDLLASNIQHLDVPSRPAAPAFTYDPVNQRTSTTVSSAFEYSNTSDMSGAVAGNGTYVSISIGTTKYFRKKATASAFKSSIQSLTGTSTPPTGSPEFVILNDIIEWPNTSDTNGFYFFYHNSAMPVNWLSPYDFYNGQVYTRFEILSQVSNEPVAFQFGIWQKLPPTTGTLYESMAEQRVLNGPGSVAIHNSSPKNWWTYNGGVDYTKMDQVWHFGINPWKTNPFQQIRQENEAVWDSRNTYWYPMQVRVTVVAVAAGHTFSGWDNYLNMGEEPDYEIDFINEKTTEVVASSDEYSYNQSSWTTGSNSKLVLVPGQDVYFRKKTSPAQVQHLVVRSRPDAPTYSIDYSNENTIQNVDTIVEYSASATFASSLTGTGARVKVTPGQDLYFRIKSSTSSFASSSFILDVPGRPASPVFSIDFQSEQTSAVVSNEYEYADNQNMTSAIEGDGSVVTLTPGSTLYFRKKASASQFMSGIQVLVVPSRPAAPVFSIDFVGESTNENLSADYEYSVSADMSGSQSGEGTELQLIPGQDYYFRVKSTLSAFASGISQLPVPERPLITSTVGDTLSEPSFTATIDFEGVVSGFDATDIIADNAIVKLIDVQKVKIEPVTYGEVSMKVKANAIQAGNFASDELITYYKEVATSVRDFLDSEGLILVYPNPATTWLEVEAGKNFILPGEIMLIDVSGNVAIHERINSERITLDLHTISSGVYILRAVDMKGNSVTFKITKQD